ncbi:MAG TPA: hypothetical protein VMW48_12185, partial [Vicinamibacterales bacterium]|nr:hypothetical protein [Vicinamibacterales bacterium]
YLVKAAYEAQLDALRKGFADKQAKEDERRAGQVADLEQRIAGDVAEERIRATMDGVRESLALLALERDRAIREAREAGAGALALGELGETYDLRAKALLAAKQGTAQARGTFSSMAIWGFGTGDSADRMTKASEQTAEYLKRYWEWVRSRGGLVFT